MRTKKTKQATMESFTKAENMVTVDNYVPNPAEGKFYIVQSDSVNIFKPFDPSKPKTAAKSLYAVGKIRGSAQTAEFIAKYGNTIIVVSKRFTKLSKKHKLMLIERICFEIEGAPNRFVNGMDDLDGTLFDNAIAAELQLMEKYGYCKTKRLLMKERRINTAFQKSAGMYLYKSAKKLKKAAINDAKAGNSNPTVQLNEPVTFKNTDPLPSPQ